MSKNAIFCTKWNLTFDCIFLEKRQIRTLIGGWSWLRGLPQPLGQATGLGSRAGCAVAGSQQPPMSKNAIFVQSGILLLSTFFQKKRQIRTLIGGWPWLRGQPQPMGQATGLGSRAGCAVARSQQPAMSKNAIFVQSGILLFGAFFQKKRQIRTLIGGWLWLRGLPQPLGQATGLRSHAGCAVAGSQQPPMSKNAIFVQSGILLLIAFF